MEERNRGRKRRKKTQLTVTAKFCLQRPRAVQQITWTNKNPFYSHRSPIAIIRTQPDPDNFAKAAYATRSDQFIINKYFIILTLSLYYSLA